MRIPFATQSYQSRSLPLSAQRVVNLYAELQPPDAKAKVVLHGTPGLTAFSALGDGPVRAMLVFDEILYAVSGTGFYRVASNGSASLVGTVTSTGDVYMAHNPTQLALLVGATGYTFDGTTLTTISDADFLGGSSLDFLDGYFIWGKPDSGQFFLSAINDGTAYDALDIATAAGSPDNLKRVFVDHRELWLFGDHSTEVWNNTGATDFPFERVSGGFIESGIAAPKAVAKLDNSVFWLDDNRLIRRADGFTPLRISTHAIEKALEGYETVADAEALAYVQEGHSFFVLNFPTAGKSWGYDASTGLFHERESSGGRWRASCYAHCYGRHLVGDYENGKIYELDLDTYTEDGAAILREAVTPPMHAEQKTAFMPRFEIEFEAGVGLTTGQGSDPKAMLQVSDDGGRTWGNERWRSIGRRGRYKDRAVWHRLGAFHQRVIRLRISDPVKVAIIAADAEMTGGGF